MARKDERRAGAWRTLRQLPGPLRVLLCGIALNRMGSFVALFIVPYLASKGFPPARAGIVLTAFGAGSVAGTFVGGSVTGRYGARRAIVASMSLSGVSIAALGEASSFPALLAIAALAGALTQVYRPAAATLMAELTPPDRLVMTSAAARLGLNVGAMAAPMLGVWLSGYSYRAVFLVNAVTSLGFAVVAGLALPESGDPGPAAPGDATPGETPAPASPRYADVLRDRRFLLVSAAMFLTAFVEIQYQAVLPLQIARRGEPLSIYGVVVALNGLLVVAIELPLTRFVQAVPMHVSLAAGTLLIGGGLALFGLPSGAWVFFLGAVVWTLGEIVSAPSVVAYPALAAPTPALRSRYIGALTTAHTLGYALGPAVGTTLFQVHDTLVWGMCAVLGLVGFGAMWRGAAPAGASLVPVPAPRSSSPALAAQPTPVHDPGGGER